MTHMIFLQKELGGIVSENTCRFGIPLLDEVLLGGVPRGTVLLVEDEVGVNSTPLIIQFLAEGIRSGDHAYILSTEHVYDFYRQYFGVFGIDEIVIEIGRLVFLDAFSNPYGHSEVRFTQRQTLATQENMITDITQPRLVADMVRRALLGAEKKGIRGVFDSLSTLIHISDNLKMALAFLQYKIATDKQSNYTTIITLHHDAHPPTTVKAIEHYADGIIRLEHIPPTDETTEKGTNVQLSVPKMPGLLQKAETPKFLYKVKPGVLELHQF